MQHYCGMNENLLKENNAGSFQKMEFCAHETDKQKNLLTNKTDQRLNYHQDLS